MYEDRTFEVIMEEMLADMPDNINTSENSLIYNALARQALKIEQMYNDMSRLYDNIVIDTMEDDMFILYAQDRGVYRKEAISTILQADFLQSIDIGTRFTANDLDYEVIEHITGYKYKLKCLTAGTIGDTTFGEIEPIDYVDDWKGGQITKVLVPGADEEDIDTMKGRYRETFNIKGFAGNKKAYRDMTMELDAVGDCYPCRIKEGETTIQIYVVDREYRAFDADTLAEIQEVVDPISDKASGAGTAPIGHDVTVLTPQEQLINITAIVTTEEAYSWDGVKDTIKDKIEEYFLSVRKDWYKRSGCTIRVSQVEYAILSVPGVLDCMNTAINGGTENIVMDYTKLPVVGTVEEAS
ncbi:MAG: baseplate J/gp47 family protein [Lachnospiraceae bacterium]